MIATKMRAAFGLSLSVIFLRKVNLVFEIPSSNKDEDSKGRVGSGQVRSPISIVTANCHQDSASIGKLEQHLCAV